MSRIFIFIIIATVFVIGVCVLFRRCRQCSEEKRKRQDILEELAPWREKLTKMNEEQFHAEFRRIRQLWIDAKDETEKLELQFELVYQEDCRRAARLVKPGGKAAIRKTLFGNKFRSELE